MSKITIAVLTLAAFLYAAWLVFLRKPLPDPVNATGLRKRFLLAVLLFAGLLGASAARGDGPSPSSLSCYDVRIPAATPVRMTRAEAVVTLQAVWRTLDRDKGKEFRAKLDVAVKQGGVPRNAAAMLQVAFDELAFHQWRTVGEGAGPTCYKPTILGGTLYTSRKNALQQLRLLDEARKNGTVDEETANKARAALAKEIEMLNRAKGSGGPQSVEEQNLLAKQYAEGEIVPSDEAKEAAGIIVEMEKGPTEQ